MCFLCVTESGNPGGLPATYSGTVSDFSNADSVIFRPPLIAADEQRLQQQHPDAVNDYRLLRTEQDSRWLNGTQFALLYVQWTASAYWIQPTRLQSPAEDTLFFRRSTISTTVPCCYLRDNKKYSNLLPNLGHIVHLKLIDAHGGTFSRSTLAAKDKTATVIWVSLFVSETVMAEYQERWHLRQNTTNNIHTTMPRIELFFLFLLLSVFFLSYFYSSASFSYGGSGQF